MAESFRSGLEAVSQTQHEIGLAIGLTPIQVFRYVVLPQATAVALPLLVPMSFSLSRKPLFLSSGFGRPHVCRQGLDWTLL